MLALAALFAAIAPVLFAPDSDSESPQTNSQFAGWPSVYEGKSLTELPLSAKEELFVQGFPGKIGRFSDGHRELIIRWVEQPSRKLHPAIDCFKGIGYYITPLPIQTNQQGIKMGCFNANKDGQSLEVCEYITAADGQSWSDVSSWYWQTFMAAQQSGWFSYVIAKNNRGQSPIPKTKTGL
jgi:hypothetical protein